MTIERIQLPAAGIDDLQREAHAEGYQFIDTLVDEWATGKNRFDAPGECLCGYWDQGKLVAVAGLTIDPFLNRPDTGRIRRVYVRPAWRNRGIARALVMTLLGEARPHFRCVRLRAENPLAIRLYEQLGFVPIADPNATHWFWFEDGQER
jgi:GNAT superfamily N-acetyltransferase